MEKLSEPSRRGILRAFGLGALSIVLRSSAYSNQVQAKGPALPSDIVKDYVIAGHGDLDAVKQMLQEHPSLLNASWDWGSGDFEMAIGGAGHMGRKDIAEFLIAQGCRADLFVLAMLNRLDVIQPLLLAYPSLRDAKGPHQIGLMAHAKKGQADDVIRFLEQL